MKQVKDNFSASSAEYRKFRPEYPDDLIKEILGHVSCCERCWDCATGNGQLAKLLHHHFDHVEATDISEKQLSEAISLPNVRYSISRAEETTFPDSYFNLITVGQAVHWFDHEAFKKEVERVAKNGCVVALIGYGLMYSDDGFDELLWSFYTETVGEYWDPEREYIDEAYETIPFPFRIIEPSKRFSIDVNWSLHQLQGYLGTWSSVKKYIEANGTDPVAPFIEGLITQDVWQPEEVKQIRFPLFVKLGRVSKTE
jgi:hypothetical protein